MKTTFLIFLIFVLCTTIQAQKKLSDRERDGLFGQVISVYYEDSSFYGNKETDEEQKCLFCRETHYDKEGNRTKIIQPGMNITQTKNIIDGFETYKTEEIIKKPPYNGFYSIVIPEEKPIEEPENLFTRDERYSYKYIYEYDSAGKVKILRTFQNNGKLIGKSIYSYDGNDRIVEETYISRTDEDQIIFKYNEKGNLIEQTSNSKSRTGKSGSKSVYVYSDYKFDSHGNWIERKVTYTFENINSQIKYENGSNIFESKYVVSRKIVYYSN